MAIGSSNKRIDVGGGAHDGWLASEGFANGSSYTYPSTGYSDGGVSLPGLQTTALTVRFISGGTLNGIITGLKPNVRYKVGLLFYLDSPGHTQKIHAQGELVATYSYPTATTVDLEEIFAVADKQGRIALAFESVTDIAYLNGLIFTESPTNLLICAGHSMLTNFGGGSTTVPDALQTILGDNWEVKKNAIAGQTAATLNANFAAQIGNDLDASNAENKYVLLWGAINDLDQNVTPANALVTIGQIVTKIRNKSATALVSTETAIGAVHAHYSYLEPARLAYNALLRASNSFDRLVDQPQVEARLNNGNNATYFFQGSDGIHLTDAGRELSAETVFKILIDIFLAPVSLKWSQPITLPTPDGAVEVPAGSESVPANQLLIARYYAIGHADEETYELLTFPIADYEKPDPADFIYDYEIGRNEAGKVSVFTKQLFVESGQLLGRGSDETGAPESIAIGAGLSLDDGVLSAPPSGIGAAQLTQSAAQSIPNAALTAINFNQHPVLDSSFAHDNATNNSRLSVTETGIYLFIANVGFAGSITGIRSFQLRKNNSAVFAISQQPNLGALFQTVGNVVGMAALSANDYVELIVYQDSGGNLNVVNDSSSVLLNAVRIK